MSETSKCNRCAAPLPPDSPEGLCPRCLIALNLATQTEIPGETGPAKPPPAPPLPVADVAKLFPQLEILECLGRGGMGAVYKARQLRLDRLVALKILSPEKQGNQKFAERFEREARALARLHHPNIVAVYDFGEVQGNFYLLMEFVDGLTLRQLLQARKLSPPEALAIVPKICEALQYAHEQGIVHRDIKPENILMDKEGQIKIADFGIAKILGDGGRTNLTEEQAIGTPHYMSPEQIEKPQSVDHRADIYSLGVVFYEMLTGELPLGKFQPPSKKVHIDVRLDEIVLRALEKEPERRYQRASEVKTQVETVVGSRQGSAFSAGAMDREYRSEQTIFGWPLIHIAWGTDPVTRRPREAKGLIASGSRATGLVAVGLRAKGVLAVGLEAYGLIAVGLIAIGGAPAGLLAVGAMPVGLVAFGLSSVGLLAYGITSVGLLAIAWLRAVGLVSVANHSIGPVHFGINAPLFLWLGFPVLAICVIGIMMFAMGITGSWRSAKSWVPIFILMLLGIASGVWSLLHMRPASPDVRELRKVTIIGLYRPDSPELPKWAAQFWVDRPTNGNDFVIAIKEWIPGMTNQMRKFQQHCPRDFLLTVSQHPQISVHLTSLDLSAGDGSFQAFGAHIDPEDKDKLVPGIAYSIQPINTSDTYQWTVAPDVSIVPEPSTNSELSSGIPSGSNSVLAQQPPVVVETFPVSGARDVEPGETEIRVRFSKDMMDGSWSWSTAWKNSAPDFIGSPHYESDSRTCVAKVKLEPGRTYAFWLNSEKFQNFRDADGHPSVPYLLIFQTKQN